MNTMCVSVKETNTKIYNKNDNPAHMTHHNISSCAMKYLNGTTSS